MSNNIVVDITNIEHKEAEITLEDRVETLEGLIDGLIEGHKNILENFREMITAVTEISEEPSEE